MYELAVTGTPIVAIRLAENQTQSVQAMGAAGVLAYAGDVHDTALGPVLVATLAALAVDPGRRAEMSLARARIVVLPLKPNSYSGATTTLLQAMAMGKPLVVSAVGATRMVTASSTV